MAQGVDEGEMLRPKGRERESGGQGVEGEGRLGLGEVARERRWMGPHELCQPGPRES